jgi:hypothetical protein
VTTLYCGDKIIRLFTDELETARQFIPEEYEFIPFEEKPYYTNCFKVGIIGGDKLMDQRKEVDRIINLKKYFDIMFVETKEVHSTHNYIFEKISKISGIYYIMPGRNHITSQSINSNFFISAVVEIYKQLNFKLDELTPYVEKIYYFDALLGLKKTHRDFIHDKIINSNNKDKFILSYNSEVGSSSWLDDNDPNIDYCGDNLYNGIIKTSGLYSRYYGIDVWASRIIPINVFNNSAYSIVAETNFFNNFNFITEKTAKPLLAKRLFVVIAGQYSLKTLRDFGFKTFDGIIDESYDLEPSSRKRWQMAWDQINWLCEQNQLEIYDKIKDITEHNFNIAMNTNFKSKVFEEILNLIS